ncbi:MAG: hypothetical protein ABI823_17890, partial [Bryobacteraceae bacterium]
DRVEISFMTMAAASREALNVLIAAYARPEAVARAFEMAWTRSQLQFRYLGITEQIAGRFQDLLGHILYPDAVLRPAERIARNRLAQPQLWAHGISGDLPILSMTIADARGLRTVRELLLAHTYWGLRGYRADLVILNQEPSGYERPLQFRLRQLVETHSLHATVGPTGGVFLLDWNAIPEPERNLILAASSVVLSGSRGPLRNQLVPPADIPQPPDLVPTVTSEEPSSPLPFLELPYFNGLGGFTADGREYAIYLKPGSRTPAPWANVMASESFGTVVTESGLGFTWFGNSQANRLSPWHNDPTSDPQSEVIYLRDEESGEVWTPTALPIRENDAYRARHGQGYTLYEHNSHGIAQQLTVFVPVDLDAADPVKICRLTVRNESSRPRRLTATHFVEWVLGTNREEQQLHVRTEWDAIGGAIVARNSWNSAYGDRVAFAASRPRASSYSGDRGTFLGKSGSVADPAALHREHLDNRAGAGLDPASVLQVELSLEPGAETVVLFLLGEADSIEQARAIVDRYGDAHAAESTLADTRRWWDQRLSVLQVNTPVLSNNLLVNRWLLYQSLSCRFWARSAIYQSGGAFGFRDQLQDCLALIYCAPDLTRAHLLRSASRQFVQGDVQHWWHPETGNGVRTRCSDDLVWLPYAVARYVEITGDEAILKESVPFLDGPTLEPGEHEKLFVPVAAGEYASLLEHCRRALEYAWQLGPHLLPLFGNGDWNDGMNLVGADGRGESTWLAWFLCSVSTSFDQMLVRHGISAGGAWKARAADLAAAMERDGWDGDWYLRGYFDDGSKLGSSQNAEARIDSIPQSWAVISGAARRDRARAGVEAALRELVLDQERLILLFTPPFDRSTPNPGYIMGYPPGVRENGGQYTHAALWLALACARLGDGNSAVRLLEMINPVERTSDTAKMEAYRGEPYVIAADIYSSAEHVGQCGWSWYTGSAAWMYRVWIEDVLGFRLAGDRLTLEPAMPDDWPGFSLTYRYRSTTYEIVVERRESPGPLQVDGRPAPERYVTLVDDGGTHRVVLGVHVAVPAEVDAVQAR